MNARTVGYVVLIGLMVWATAGAQEKAPTKRKAKLAASPEEAVMMQTEAAKVGDVETYFGLIAEPSSTLWRLYFGIGAAKSAFRAAMEEQFSSGRQGTPKGTAERMQEILKNSQAESVRVLETTANDAKDRAEMRVEACCVGPGGRRTTFVNQVVAVKQGNEWKLLVPFMGIDVDDAKQVERVRGLMQTRIEAMEAAIKAVKAGKYATREEVQRELAGLFRE